MAMTLMALLPAMTAACRSNKTAPAVTVEKTATATLKATSADTLRTQSEASLTATATSVSGDRESTRIRIARDSAGRPTDIQVDRKSSGSRRTESSSMERKASEAAASREAAVRSVIKENAREAVPVVKENHGTARAAVAVVFFAIFALLGTSLALRAWK